MACFPWSGPRITTATGLRRRLSRAARAPSAARGGAGDEQVTVLVALAWRGVAWRWWRCDATRRQHAGKAGLPRPSHAGPRWPGQNQRRRSSLQAMATLAAPWWARSRRPGAGHGPAARLVYVGPRIAAQAQHPAAVVADDAARPAEATRVAGIGDRAQRSPRAQVAALGHADVEAIVAVRPRPHHGAEQPEDALVVVEQRIAVSGILVPGQDDGPRNRLQVDAGGSLRSSTSWPGRHNHASPRLAAPCTLLF